MSGPRLPSLVSIPMLLLVAFGQSWPISMASAADIAVTSEIDAITVFQTGAEITRTFTVELEPGEHRLQLLLPNDIQRNSIQIEGTTQSEVSISALDLRLAPVDTGEKDARDAELQEKISILGDQVRRETKTLENAAFTRRLVETLAQRKLQPTGQDTTPPVPEPEALNSLLDMVDGRLSRISETMLDAQARKAEAENRISDLIAKLSERPSNTVRDWQASVHVVAQNAASASFRLRYRLNSASWEPLYEARLTTSETGHAARLELVRNATVAQTTTEDWNDVALTLSTAQRTSSISPPTLEPQNIRSFTRESDGELPRATIGLSASSDSNDSIAQGGDTTDAAGTVGRMQASATIAGFNALYAIPGRVTIDRSGNVKKVRIGSSEDFTDLFLTVVPKLDLTAYLVARFKANNSTPLLPGRVMLFREGVFVGEGQLPLTAPGEMIKLGFGADDLVTVEHYEVARKSGETGLVSTAYVEERSYLTRITSGHSFSIPVTVKDQVPVSDDERIRVELLQGTTRPDGEDVDGRSGVYSWTETLEPNVTQEIRFGFRVTWPKGMTR